MIRTTGLGKRYPTGAWPARRGAPVHALEGLDIEVHAGEIFGFLGPNGAGKSTTIRILLGFLHPTAGAATILGHDVVRDSLAIRRQVGYLPGGISLYDSMNGLGLLDYLADLYGRPAPLRDGLIDRLELSDADLRRPVRDYSRGMRQKIGIIQALQHDPELAILDEPTEGLDPLMQNAFLAVLEERRRAGRTVFFSSHVLSEVERVCDRVAIIRGGLLVALAPVATLLAHRRRHVEMRVEGRPPHLDGVPGVSAVATYDGVVRCDLEGDVGPFLAAHRDGDGPGPDHRARAPGGGIPGVLRAQRGDARMIGALFRRTLQANRVRLVACLIGLVVWGAVLPVVYANFGQTIGTFIRNSNNPLMEQFANFGGGDLFSLDGAIALGFIHPISIAILGVFFVGFPILSIVGERQRGTLEVLLARPISRHQLYLVLLLAGALSLAVLLAFQLLGCVASSELSGVGSELEVANMPLVWGMGWLMAVTFMAVGLAASVSFDRVMPALGVTLVFILVSYVVEVVGTIWPSAAWVSDYSLFHYVRTKELLEGQVRLGDIGILVGVLLVAVGYAWVVFPRRDIAAPS